jgi:hypothetical protein
MSPNAQPLPLRGTMTSLAPDANQRLYRRRQWSSPTPPSTTKDNGGRIRHWFPRFPSMFGRLRSSCSEYGSCSRQRNTFTSSASPPGRATTGSSNAPPQIERFEAAPRYKFRAIPASAGDRRNCRNRLRTGSRICARHTVHSLKHLRNRLFASDIRRSVTEPSGTLGMGCSGQHRPCCRRFGSLDNIHLRRLVPLDMGIAPGAARIGSINIGPR